MVALLSHPHRRMAAWNELRDLLVEVHTEVSAGHAPDDLPDQMSVRQRTVGDVCPGLPQRGLASPFAFTGSWASVLLELADDGCSRFADCHAPNPRRRERGGRPRTLRTKDLDGVILAKRLGRSVLVHDLHQGRS